MNETNKTVVPEETEIPAHIKGDKDPVVEEVKVDTDPYKNWDKKKLINRIEELEYEIGVLNNRLTRARSQGVPRGMGR